MSCNLKPATTETCVPGLCHADKCLNLEPPKLFHPLHRAISNCSIAAPAIFGQQAGGRAIWVLLYTYVPPSPQFLFFPPPTLSSGAFFLRQGPVPPLSPPSPLLGPVSEGEEKINHKEVGVGPTTRDRPAIKHPSTPSSNCLYRERAAGGVFHRRFHN